MKQICVIGGGRWGENHIRTLHEMGNLGAVVDLNALRLQELKTKDFSAEAAKHPKQEVTQ